MSVMFSDDALQCHNLRLRVNREWAKCYCFSQRKSIDFQAKSGTRSTIVDLPICRSCPTLLAPQRHNDLLIATGKNDAPILNGFELDLIILSTRLQAELLAFLHALAVDNRKARSLVESDRSKEEGG